MSAGEKHAVQQLAVQRRAQQEARRKAQQDMVAQLEAAAVKEAHSSSERPTVGSTPSQSSRAPSCEQRFNNLEAAIVRTQQEVAKKKKKKKKDAAKRAAQQATAAKKKKMRFAWSDPMTNIQWREKWKVELNALENYLADHATETALQEMEIDSDAVNDFFKLPFMAFLDYWEDRTPSFGQPLSIEDRFNEPGNFSNFVKVGPLDGLVSLHAWKNLDVGLTYPVNVLVCGEYHTHSSKAHAIQRYIFGQMALGKCIDVYIESPHDWTSVGQRGKPAHSTQKGRGELSALMYLRRNLTPKKFLPGLRVHDVDMRIVLPEGQDGVNKTKSSNTDNPYMWWMQANKVYPQIVRAIEKDDLFDFSAYELFYYMTGLRVGTTTNLEELDKRYAADLSSLKSLTGLSADEEEAVEAVETTGSFDIRRQRFQKQYKRFIASRPDLDVNKFNRDLSAYISGRFEGDVKLSGRFEGDVRRRRYRAWLAGAIVMDLFMFLRMFATFEPRAGGENKQGCPLEQRNIIVHAGGAHSLHLGGMIAHFFGKAKELISIGTIEGIYDEDTVLKWAEEIKKTPAFRLF